MPFCNELRIDQPSSGSFVSPGCVAWRDRLKAVRRLVEATSTIEVGEMTTQRPKMISLPSWSRSQPRS